jgi:hypothetical protein
VCFRPRAPIEEIFEDGEELGIPTRREGSQEFVPGVLIEVVTGDQARAAIDRIVVHIDDVAVEYRPDA